MSSNENAKVLDEIGEAQLAAVLGLPPAELSKLGYVVEEKRSGEGAVTGFTIRFNDSAPHDILNKIPGLQDSRWVEVSPQAFDVPDPYA